MSLSDVVFLSEPHMCEFNPCSHGATCVETAKTYTCACAWGFSGPKCESK